MAAAKRANVNTLFVQVRRRGDALYTKGVEPPRDHAAAVPAMPWIEHPERGWIAGTLAAGAGSDNDDVVVKVKRKRFWPFGRTTRVRTDGDGYFGLANVKPGRHEVSVDARGKRAAKVEVRAEAGKVTRVNLSASPAAGPHQESLSSPRSTR